MTPSEYERYVGQYFARQGYAVKSQPGSHDYGVDLFATKGPESVAVQVKMYGTGTHSVNHEMVMYLYAGRDLFRCQRAVLVTDGKVLEDAAAVAKKLGVEIMHLPQPAGPRHGDQTPAPSLFDKVWQEYIMPLAGQDLIRAHGECNRVLKVDWTGLLRLTSKGNEQFIKIEIFRWAVERLRKDGVVTRDAINQQYSGRASSGVCLILSQVPYFECATGPARLIYRG